MASTLPLFPLYGDPPADPPFDFIQPFHFIHVETIASRSSIHDWSIRAHRHRKLFQIVLIERGGGEMTYEAATLPFTAPAIILVPATVAHGFRFEPFATDGWVLSFSEDAAVSSADHAGEAPRRLRVLAEQPIIPLNDDAECLRLGGLCAKLFEENRLACEGYRLAERGLLMLIVVGVVRLAASHARTGSVTLQPADGTVAQFRALVEEHFNKQRQLGFYAEKIGMTIDRLNDHVKSSNGVTAGHLIRQRVLTEAKRQLVFTAQPIHDIAADLAFANPSHFARFFRKQTGTTPHDFREQQA